MRRRYITVTRVVTIDVDLEDFAREYGIAPDDARIGEDIEDHIGAAVEDAISNHPLHYLWSDWTVKEAGEL